MATLQEVVGDRAYISDDVGRSMAALNRFKLKWFAPRQRGGTRTPLEHMRVPEYLLTFITVLRVLLSYPKEGLSAEAGTVVQAFVDLHTKLATY